MNIKITFSLLIFFLLGILKVSAQEFIFPIREVKDRSFAIVIDSKTWVNCREAILDYRDVLDGEGLPAFILASEWQDPEEIKTLLYRLYQENNLEGAVFIGEIPIPMIRKAQHMTSAFKMDEDRFPMRESSVPSDRFYDDFDLKFDFIGQDSISKDFFYYNLSPMSPQEICCDIYTGRIKPIKGDDVDYYLQIRDYLAKVVDAHKEKNHLDEFVSYTGEGSYSNSLTAWQSEQQTLDEQFPKVFDRRKNARFIRYNMWDYPKKEILKHLQREETDLMVFHEHGMPERQYLSGTPAFKTSREQLEVLKAGIRQKIRDAMEAGKDCQKEMQKWADRFQVDSSWWQGFNRKECIEEDSLTDLKTGIILEEVPWIAPNVRMVIFDACYNGDFREDDYIAGRYIFSSGKCIAAYANSVNVLQDKSANDLLGLLGLGVRIGFWAQCTNILESHILGDPTYRFASACCVEERDAWTARKQSKQFWLDLLHSTGYPDVQNLALIRLYQNSMTGISDTLKYYFEYSPYSMVRYQCMTLLEKINDRNFHEVLKKAVRDPYEFIRRTSIDRMGKVGKQEFLPYIVRSGIEDYFSQRVVFNVQMALGLYRWKDIKECLEKELSHASVLNKEEIIKQMEQKHSKEWQYKAAMNLADGSIPDRNKIFEIRYLKNANYHPGLPFFLKTLKNPEASIDIRLALMESLAWFRLSEHKDSIVKVCTEILNGKDEDPRMIEEATRAFNRLTRQVKNR